MRLNKAQDDRLRHIFNDGWERFEKTGAPYPMRFHVMRAAAEALGYFDTEKVLKNWLVAREASCPGFMDRITPEASQ